MNVMNKAQAEALFRRECVLIDTSDAMPVFIAEKLLGKDAVKQAHNLSDVGRHWNVWGDLDYLTYAGFLYAVSCFNASKLMEGAGDFQ